MSCSQLFPKGGNRHQLASHNLFVVCYTAVNWGARAWWVMGPCRCVDWTHSCLYDWAPPCTKSTIDFHMDEAICSLGTQGGDLAIEQFWVHWQVDCMCNFSIKQFWSIYNTPSSDAWFLLPPRFWYWAFTPRLCCCALCLLSKTQVCYCLI
jgi:hypothetical protein